MSNRGGLYQLLALPAVYRLFRAVVLGDAPDPHVRVCEALPGEKVLDIGCGRAKSWNTSPRSNTSASTSTRSTSARLRITLEIAAGSFAAMSV
jgi:hypothetical protein